ncbi:hypothetical protein MGG_16158 [Pyricularia oryzae 70-15]|uniref:Uncharacterized protein n=3 Tax=Pyricularia oryzae TaxID=318829 RepID=G4ML63_PYRO7|nr:uncharacterized protein MGG_16158 [Pyricularia oryzae 70-15]EHA56799.1 hypothetical protein MGG_16158 [Pyricularia oryzae 70-15]ELQ33949.1 hypothetical protein OOU_Y34scaffold00836g2 [Pyricularia oryzae Y34]
MPDSVRNITPTSPLFLVETTSVSNRTKNTWYQKHNEFMPAVWRPAMAAGDCLPMQN